jgi:hypothetical protein
MKIALCLSGQPRGVPLALSFLQKHVINPNGINDIFIHAWFDEKEAGKTWNSAQPHRNSENQDFGNPQHAKDVGFIKSGTDKILLECLEPHGFLILGLSESLNGINNSVQLVAPSTYRIPPAAAAKTVNKASA